MGWLSRCVFPGLKWSTDTSLTSSDSNVPELLLCRKGQIPIRNDCFGFRSITVAHSKSYESPWIWILVVTCRVLRMRITFMRIRIHLFTLMRIRIQLFTSMRIHIQLFTFMRIRIQLFTFMRILIQLFTSLRIRIGICGALGVHGSTIFWASKASEFFI